MTEEAPQSARQVVESVLLDPRERRKLVAFARSRYGISHEDAEDLLQETAFELLRQRQYVHSPVAFVFVVFRRRCIQLLRQRKVRLEDLEAARNVEDRSSGGCEGFDQRLAVRQGLTAISSACRKLLAAYYLQGRSLREAAAMVALASSGAGTTINRCLQRLRACLT